MEEELQQLEALKEQLIVYLATNGVQLVIAVLILLAGFWIGKSVANLILKICEKRQIDLTLARFFSGFAKVLIIAFALIMSLSKAGIEITPFIALLGASAFGLSLAVQGPVSNYGAGIVLIVTRPFRVGDTLTVSGQSGVVDFVKLGSTELTNEDEERITIPNRKVLGEIFTNSHEYRIVEGVVGIDYAADPEQAIGCITQAVKSVDGCAEDREPVIGIDAFADSSINIGFRVWVPTNSYHRKRFALNLAVYHALKKAEITIPFPQRDVHLIRSETEQ
ncbi:mechanosensitive ion channel protein MscS [Coraliomargarita sinensis]|uniref:Mechanosensitive ion channel protein MscS n=1 Tax=Coraliomargarita sinensis TaxID=2174842 RepID=A0A317ZHL8_9BACT|nr:mechanosensitive ion channel family protein [Coraliomargarita sinensis]PXA03733.1 mechanosensitive ion channel protein MscS [Coraliomargarita sinensis]